MENENIINAFKYLTDEYKCSYLFKNDHGDTYLFYNDVFKLKIYVWMQFNELDINLVYNMVNYHIDPYMEDPRKFLEIKKRQRGLKGLFYNYDKEFWCAIAIIVKRKINYVINYQ